MGWFKKFISFLADGFAKFMGLQEERDVLTSTF